VDHATYPYNLIDAAACENLTVRLEHASPLSSVA
jgi:hypothetical protein